MNDPTENGITYIFSFDGTSKDLRDLDNRDSYTSISNIAKLHFLMGGDMSGPMFWRKNDVYAEQKTHYYSGVGNWKVKSKIPLIGGALLWVRNLINKMFAPSFGDVRRILNKAIEDFRECNVRSQDNLVIFGYSRGAAIGRKFAAVLLSENPELEVDFLGCFDTVAAMDGVHRKGEKLDDEVVFENGTLNARVRSAVHIVALDEQRVPYEPTLMNFDRSSPGRILEVWFPGTHGDVGGGFWESELADQALFFMMQQVAYELPYKISFHDFDTQSLEELAKERNISIDDLFLDPSVLGKMHKTSNVLYNISQFAQPREVCVMEDDRPSNILPLVYSGVLGRCREIDTYRPQALRDKEYILLHSDEDELMYSDDLYGVRDLKSTYNRDNIMYEGGPEWWEHRPVAPIG